MSISTSSACRPERIRLPQHDAGADDPETDDRRDVEPEGCAS